MGNQLLDYGQQTLWDLTGSTSLPELEVGKELCNSQDGPKMNLFGQEVAPALLSRMRGRKNDALNAAAKTLYHILSKPEFSCAVNVSMSGKQTEGTFGLSSEDLLKSVDLDIFLESRYRQKMEGFGSLEYTLRWKRWDMAFGRSILALRGSTLRTSDKDCFGWPTTRHQDSYERRNWKTIKKIVEQGGDLTLPTLVKYEAVSGWGTPKVATGKYQRSNGKVVLNLEGQVDLVSGQISNTSIAKMGKQGGYQLNPLFSGWLQGFSPEWILVMEN